MERKSQKIRGLSRGGSKSDNIIYLSRHGAKYNANTLTTRMIYDIEYKSNPRYDDGIYSIENVIGSKHNGRYKYLHNFVVLLASDDSEDYYDVMCYRFEKVGSGETIDIIEGYDTEYSGSSIIDTRTAVYENGLLVPAYVQLKHLSRYNVLYNETVAYCTIKEYVDPEDMKNVTRVVNRKYRGRHSDIKTHIKTYLMSSAATKKNNKRKHRP